MTDLAQIQSLSEARIAQNDRFSSWLKTFSSNDIDALVFPLQEKITDSIDCRACGNCCQTLLINVTEPEANDLAEHLQISRQALNDQYLEKGMTDTLLINAIPCHFLKEKQCSVYAYRFSGCREFPAMHLPHFTTRLFTTLMHYGRCPIIFNVIEQLKILVKFE